MKDDPANASFVREGDYALLTLFLVEVLTFSAGRFKLEVIGFRLCALQVDVGAIVERINVVPLSRVFLVAVPT